MNLRGEGSLGMNTLDVALRSIYGKQQADDIILTSTTIRKRRLYIFTTVKVRTFPHSQHSSTPEEKELQELKSEGQMIRT